MMDFASNPREETTCVSPDAPVGAGPMFTLAMSKKQLQVRYNHNEVFI